LAIKSRRIRWAGDVEGMGRGAYMLLMGKPERRGHLKDPGIDGRTILKWIFKK
jgi:hypothetical protein